MPSRLMVRWIAGSRMYALCKVFVYDVSVRSFPSGSIRFVWNLITMTLSYITPVLAKDKTFILVYLSQGQDVRIQMSKLRSLVKLLVQSEEWGENFDRSGRE